MKKVFTNGCFDILHPGHVSVLDHAKALGDWLIVGLNSDASVRRLKGNKRPIIPEIDRKIMLEAIRYVDEVILFDDLTPIKLIEEIRPDILVKGGDYAVHEIVGGEFVKSYGGTVVCCPLIEGKSTTQILGRILS